MKYWFPAVLLLVAVIACNTPSTNMQMKRISPHDTLTGTVNGTTIKLVYGSPGVKGRQIWGALVPYDKPWRGGADEATLFTTDKAITVGDKPLPAGTYSVFVIPSKDMWTYIFNSQTGQWGIKEGGAANFEPAQNVLTVTATPKEVPMTEQLTYKVGNEGFGLRWEKLEALVSVK